MFSGGSRIPEPPAPQEAFYPKNLQPPAEAYGRRYSRYNAPNPPAQSPAAQEISKHPVIRILRRIDELERQDQAGHRIKDADWTRAELEACLAAIHQSAN